MLGIGHDNLPDDNGVVNAGQIKLDKDGVKVIWKDVGKKRNYNRLDKVLLTQLSFTRHIILCSGNCRSMEHVNYIYHSF